MIEVEDYNITVTMRIDFEELQLQRGALERCDLPRRVKDGILGILDAIAEQLYDEYPELDCGLKNDDE